jgi:hypothetical protein
VNILNHFEKVASRERKWNGTKHDQTCEPKSGSILTCWFAGTGVILTVLETAGSQGETGYSKARFLACKLSDPGQRLRLAVWLRDVQRTMRSKIGCSQRLLRLILPPGK